MATTSSGALPRLHEAVELDAEADLLAGVERGHPIALLQGDTLEQRLLREIRLHLHLAPHLLGPGLAEGGAGVGPHSGGAALLRRAWWRLGPLSWCH
eukprot:scaffold31485_cov57-Phaeocystis_antarctica.AAC.3